MAGCRMFRHDSGRITSYNVCYTKLLRNTHEWLHKNHIPYDLVAAMKKAREIKRF